LEERWLNGRRGGSMGGEVAQFGGEILNKYAQAQWGLSHAASGKGRQPT
jgi:molybdenum-dependent DNA-binding transcriptional regulator ModE